MEPCVEIFIPSRWYARVGWFALAGSAGLAAFGFRSPVFLILSAVSALIALFLLWLSSRPAIQVGETQFNIGERAIAWREVKEVNRIRILSPLILRIKLTNSRRRTLVYPGELSRVEQTDSSFAKEFASCDVRRRGLPRLLDLVQHGGLARFKAEGRGSIRTENFFLRVPWISQFAC